MLTVKDSVQFAVIAPGGFRILSGMEQVIRPLPFDLQITSGTDGVHSGPDDPHHHGGAYDFNSHTLTVAQKQDLVLAFINKVMEASETASATSGGWASAAFFAFVEDAGTPNEHIHAQIRRQADGSHPFPLP